MTDDERISKTAVIVTSMITISLVKFTLGLYWTEAILGFVVGTTVLAALNFGIRRLSVFLAFTFGLRFKGWVSTSIVLTIAASVLTYAVILRALQIGISASIEGGFPAMFPISPLSELAWFCVATFIAFTGSMAACTFREIAEYSKDKSHG